MQCHNRDVYEKQIIDLQVDHQTIYIFEGKDIFQKLSQIQAQQRLVCNFVIFLSKGSSLLKIRVTWADFQARGTTSLQMY